jgi:NADH-quinone oxidoreductase subunit I
MYGSGVLKGLWVTLKHFWGTYFDDIKKFPRRYAPNGQAERRPYRLTGLFTMQYPEERYAMFPRFRGALMQLRSAETGKPNCTACNACIRACPHGCITLDGVGKGKERTVAWYKYDLARCIFCRLCVEACPFGAIEMSHEYELSRYENRFVLELDELLTLGDKSGLHGKRPEWGESQ